MNYIKIDEEKLKRDVESTKRLFDRKIYLICNESTAKALTEKETIVFVNGKFIGKSKFNEAFTGEYYGAKILLDNDLSFGEIKVR